MNPTLLESLRALAVCMSEPSFSHLVTAAINGEQFAIDRMPGVLAEIRSVMRHTDLTRPDGGTPRAFNLGDPETP